MTAIEKANYDAQVLGGYTTGFMYDRLAAIDPLGAMEVLWFDRKWWEALGKARGWGRLHYRQSTPRCIRMMTKPTPNRWKKEWHRFIDHLAEGKSAEEFFQTL